MGDNMAEDNGEEEVEVKPKREERKQDYDRGRDRGRDGREKKSSNTEPRAEASNSSKGGASKVTVPIVTEDISFLLGSSHPLAIHLAFCFASFTTT
jgi:hypothetical protein